MYCMKCGTQTLVGASFCGGCGSAIVTEAPPALAGSPPKEPPSLTAAATVVAWSADRLKEQNAQDLVKILQWNAAQNATTQKLASNIDVAATLRLQNNLSHGILAMRFAKCTFSPPDGDGDMRTDVQVNVTNTSPHTIRMVRMTTMMHNAAGDAVAASTRNDTLVKLGDGDSMNLNAGSPYFKAALLGAQPGRVECKVYATTFMREFHKLGATEIPAKPGVIATLSTTVKSELIAPDIRVVVSTTAPDEDGNVNVEWKAALQSVTDRHIAKATLRGEIVDEEGAIVESGESEIDVLAKSCEFVESSIWGLKKSQIRGTQLTLTVTLYTALETQLLEGTANEDED